MVRWPGVMWRRLTLTLLLASMASSSGSACPEFCQCSRITSRDSQPYTDGYNDTTEIHCKGTIPRIEFLPQEISTLNRLVVEGTEPHAIQNMLMDLETRWSSNNNRSIEELAIINCSLAYLNITKEFVATRLNLSNNHFEEIEALRIESKGENNLDRLDLSSNRLSRVRNEAFSKFPRLVQLTLRRNRISVVEKGAFAGLGFLESLDLSENNLAALVEDVFVSLSFLQKLDLSGNAFNALDGRWFNSLGRLRELDVSRNGLARSKISTTTTNKDNSTVTDKEVKQSGTLEALPFGLTILRLADNPLMELELSLVLGSGRRLETVDASRIGLDRVPPALTRSVRDLTLAGNKLTTIRSGDFDSYPLLRLLDLSNNSLRVVEEDALGRLEVLEKLDLSGNKLIELPQSLPSSLVHLVIRYNSIGKLTSKDLQGLNKLEKLFLDNNAISEIEEGSMSQLNLLTELDISDNPLKQIPANTFAGPRSLVVLRMSGLISLEWEREKRADMAFPVPAPERLVSLDLSRSPALAAQLLADEAALSACKSLRQLNLAQTNLTTLRSDLAYLLPQLHTLGLSGNEWNCTSANPDVYWLADWIQQHEEIQPIARCAKSSKILNFGGDNIMLAELPSAHTSSSSTIEIAPTRSLSIESNGTETYDVSYNSEVDKEESNDQTRLSTVPNLSHSRTININSIIKTTASGVSVDSNNDDSEIDSSTESIKSSVSNAQNEENFKEDKSEISQLPTIRIRTVENIIVFGDKKLNFVDDNSKKTEKIESMRAEELSGPEEVSKSEFSESQTDLTIRAHPGMLVVFAGAALGLVATLSVVLSRRLAGTITNQRIILSSQEQHPIVTELW